MKRITKSIQIYVAKDGQEFTSEKECIEYERQHSNIKYFRSVYRPDLTEGRGYSSEIFMAINPIASYIHSAYALKHMLQLCKGLVVDYVQGCEHAAMVTFSIPELITKEQYDKARPGSIGDYPRNVTKVLLSDQPIQGYPKNIKISRGRIV